MVQVVYVLVLSFSSLIDKQRQGLKKNAMGTFEI